MDLPMALALSARANAFFRGVTSNMEVLAGHPSFVRCHDLAFVRQTGLGGEIAAEGSLPWFRRLRNEGVMRIRSTVGGLRLEKGRDAPWGLLTEGDRGLELWSVSIGRRFQGYGDLQPFRVSVTSSRFDRWSLKAPLSVEEASGALHAALAEAMARLEAGGQTLASAAVGKFLGLHDMECPEVKGELAVVAADLLPCARALFASGTRAYALIETTGWLNSQDDSLRALAEPLWAATLSALESAV